MIRTRSPMNPDLSAARDAQITGYYQALLQQLATKAQITEEGPCRVLGITSSSRGEGVSSVCANLAAVAAPQLRSRALLIDANVAQPEKNKLSPLRGGPGLADILQGDAPANDCFRPTSRDDVWVLPTGTPTSRDAMQAPPGAITRMMQLLRERFGLIIVDLPIASQLHQCFAITATLDGIVLVVEAERTRHQVVRRAKEQILQANSNLIGVVFNKRRQYVPDWIYRRL